MDDKLFLTYFNELSSRDLDTKKQASLKIVETLKVTEALEKHKDYSHLDEKVLKMLKKYLKGDLGAKVSPDLTFTFKK
jgi:hypothetical protein